MRERITAAAPWTYLIRFADGLFSIDREEWPNNRHVLAVQHQIARTILPLIDKFSPDRKNASILDVGCNCGWFSLLLAERGYGSVTGIDVNSRNIFQAGLAKELKGLLNVHFERVDMAEIAARKGRFDTVVCMGVLNHLNTPVEFLKNLHAVTSGHLFIDLYMRAPENMATLGGDFLDIGGGMTCGFEDQGAHKQPGEYEFVFQYSREAVLHMLQYVGFRDILEVSPRLASVDQYRAQRVFFIAARGEPDDYRRELRLAEAYNGKKSLDFLDPDDPISNPSVSTHVHDLLRRGKPRYGSLPKLREYYANVIPQYKTRSVYVWVQPSVWTQFERLFAASKIAAFIVEDGGGESPRTEGVPVLPARELKRIQPGPLFICSVQKEDIVANLRIVHPEWRDIP